MQCPLLCEADVKFWLPRQCRISETPWVFQMWSAGCWRQKPLALPWLILCLNVLFSWWYKMNCKSFLHWYSTRGKAGKQGILLSGTGHWPFKPGPCFFRLLLKIERSVWLPDSGFVLFCLWFAELCGIYICNKRTVESSLGGFGGSGMGDWVVLSSSQGMRVCFYS